MMSLKTYVALFLIAALVSVQGAKPSPSSGTLIRSNQAPWSLNLESKSDDEYSTTWNYMISCTSPCNIDNIWIEMDLSCLAGAHIPIDLINFPTDNPIVFQASEYGTDFEFDPAQGFRINLIDQATGGDGAILISRFSITLDSTSTIQSKQGYFGIFSSVGYTIDRVAVPECKDKQEFRYCRWLRDANTWESVTIDPAVVAWGMTIDDNDIIPPSVMLDLPSGKNWAENGNKGKSVWAQMCKKANTATTTQEDLSCSFDSASYSMSCAHPGAASLSLSGVSKSQGSSIMRWNAPGYVSLSNTASLSPTLSIAQSAHVCSSNFQLSLTVESDGETFTCSTNIDLADLTAPVISAADNSFTPNIDVSCGDVPGAPAMYSSDLCDPSPQMMYTETESQDGNVLVLTRTWRAQDFCGNDAIPVTQTLHIRDNEAPTIVLGDDTAEIIAECGNVPPTCEHHVLDQCDNPAPIAVYSETETHGYSCASNYDILRKWEVQDAAGNAATKTQTVRVRDSNGPNLIGVPADASIECDEYDTVIQSSYVYGHDECEGDSDQIQPEFSDKIPGDCIHNYEIDLTWTACDSCNNCNSESQRLQVSDTTAPVFDRTIEGKQLKCTEPIPDCDLHLHAEDNCDEEVSVQITNSVTSEPWMCPDQKDLHYTWTSVDTCGNSNSHTATWNIVDEDAPYWAYQDSHSPIGSDLVRESSTECDAVVDPIYVLRDDCDPDPDEAMSKEIIDFDNLPYNDNYQIKYTWTGDDRCGNAAPTLVHTLTVTDSTPPTIVPTPPTTITAQCHEDITIPSPEAEDNCDPDPSFETNVQNTPGSCTSEYTLVVTYIAKDRSLNTHQAMTTISVRDMQAPELSFKDWLPLGSVGGILHMPFDDVASFNYWNVMETAVTATDLCTDVTSNFNEVRQDGDCDREFQITYTWEFRDDCNLVSSHQLIINVFDDNMPTFSHVPATQTCQCHESCGDADLYRSSSDYPTATDSDGTPVDVTMVQTVEPGSTNCLQKYRRTFTADDGCGNIAIIHSYVFVEDGSYPEWDYGTVANRTQDIDGPAPFPQPLLDPQASDCNLLSINRDTTPSDGLCVDTITYLWSTSDECNNVNPQAFAETYTVYDRTGKELQVNREQSVYECSGSDTYENEVTFMIRDSDTDGAWTSASSNIQSSDLTLLGDSCDRQGNQIWQHSDECDNLSPTVGDFWQILDTTAPALVHFPDREFTCPTLLLEAYDALNPSRPGIDACPDTLADLELNFIQDWHPNQVGDWQLKDFTRQLTLNNFDICGNGQTQTAIWTARDTTPPVLSVNDAQQTLECVPGSDNLEGNMANSVPSMQPATASDTCDPDPDVTSSESSDFANCVYTESHHYTATDFSDNVNTATRTYQVADTTAPSYDLPTFPAYHEKCTPPPELLASLAAQDCDPSVPLTIQAQTSTSETELTFRFTASDSCGNQFDESRTISLIDQPPIWVSDDQPSITYECEAEEFSHTADDTCDGTGIVNGNALPATCGSHIRTFQYCDSANQCIDRTQIVTIVDNDKPFAVTNEAELPWVSINGEFVHEVTVEYGAATPNPFTAYTGQDNCGRSVSKVVDSETEPLDCANNNNVIYTMTLTDDCSNTATYKFIYKVRDTTPADIQCTDCGLQQLECWIEADPLQASYAPDASPYTEAFVTFTNGSCVHNKDLIFTYRNEDECGNLDEETGLRSFSDSDSPVINNWDDLTIECDTYPDYTFPIVSAVDNCDGSRSVAETTINNCVNPDSYPCEIIKTYSSVDLCQNPASSTSVLTLDDTTDPEFVNFPNDATISINAGYVFFAPNQDVTDNCATIVSPPEVTPTPGDCLANQTYTVTHSACDLADNCISEFYTVETYDNTPPEFVWQSGETPVAEVTYQHHQNDKWEESAWPVATATDNFDAQVDVIRTYVLTPGDNDHEFTYTITYTAVDDCLNEAVFVHIINVIDDIPPEIVGIPDPELIPCVLTEETATTRANEILVEIQAAVDLEQTGVTVSLVGEPTIVNLGCSIANNFTFTYQACDPANNCDTGYWWTSSYDTGAPYFTDPQTEPPFTHYECSLVDIPVAAEDNCDGIITPVYNLDTANNKRTWTITDVCGNTKTWTQEFIVEDTHAPEITNPPEDIALSCDDQVPDAPLIVATDNCVDPTSTYSETEQNTLCQRVITRTWTFTDGYHSTPAQQVITVNRDLTPSVSNGAGQVSFTCEEGDFNAPTAVDACTGSELTPTVSKVGSPFDYSYNYVFVDECQNSASGTVDVSITDDEDPNVNGDDASFTPECLPDLNTVKPGDWTKTDNCAVESSSLTQSHTTDGVCNLDVTFTGAANDYHFNTGTDSWTISYSDQTGPSLTLGWESNTFECNVDTPSAPDYEASDCPGNAVSVTISPIQPEGYYGGWRFTAVDECDNPTTADALYNIVDTLPPSIVSDNTAFFHCAAEEVTAVASDTCDDNVELTFEDTPEVHNCVHDYTFTRRFTARDKADLTAVASTSVVVQDWSSPQVAQSAIDTNLSCDAQGDWEQIVDDALAWGDDCTSDAQLLVSLSTTGVRRTQDGVGSLTVTSTATDQCDKSASESITFTFTDSVDPYQENGAAKEQNLRCGSDDSFQVPTFADICDTIPSVTQTSTTSGSCPYLPRTDYTYVVSDLSGNTIIEQFSAITVENGDIVYTDVPPLTLSIDCSETVTDEMIEDLYPTASHPCDDNVVFSHLITGDQVQITATPTCQDPVFWTIDIIVTDTEAPEFDTLHYTDENQVTEHEFSNVTKECTAETKSVLDIITIANPTLDSSDNCDPNPEEQVVECINTDMGLECIYESCDNYNNCHEDTWTYDLEDTVPPTVSHDGADIVYYECGVDTEPGVQWEDEDACGIEERSNFFTEVTPYAREQTHSVTDISEQSASDSVLLVQVDNLPPHWTESEPSPEELHCLDLAARIEYHQNNPPAFLDECSTDLIPTQTTSTAGDDCTSTITISWTVTDSPLPSFLWTDSNGMQHTISQSGGLSTSDTFDIVLQHTDNAAPTFVYADDITEDRTQYFDCSQITEPPAFTVEDDCQDADSITSSSAITATNRSDSSHTWYTEYTYTATDGCGNTATDVWTQYYSDTTAPTFVDVPEDTSADCQAVPPAAAVTAEDDCAEEVSVSVNEEIIKSDGCDCNYVIKRTWFTCDLDGNCATSRTQIVTVSEPDYSVTIHNVPQDMSANRLADIPAQDAFGIYATDAYGNLVSVSMSETYATAEGNTLSSLELYKGLSSYQIIRTFSAESLSGCYSATDEYIINFHDDQEPNFNDYPEDVELDLCVEPEDILDYACILQVVGEDNHYLCALDGSDCAEQIAVTVTVVNSQTIQYSASDRNGNTRTHLQTITHRIDQAPPVFSHTPEDSNTECSCELVTPTITATDDCDSSVVVSEIIPGYDVTQAFPQIYDNSWSAVDASGNDASYSQTVTYTDTQSPYFLASVEPELNLDCSAQASWEAPQLDYYDECVPAELLSYNLNQEHTQLACGLSQFSYSWEVRDPTGNFARLEQVVRFSDSHAPMYGGEHVTKLCYNDVYYSISYEDLLLDLTDDCSSSINVAATFCNSTRSGGSNLLDSQSEDSCNASPTGVYFLAEPNTVFDITFEASDCSGQSSTFKKSFLVPEQNMPDAGDCDTDTSHYSANLVSNQ